MQNPYLNLKRSFALESETTNLNTCSNSDVAGSDHVNRLSNSPKYLESTRARCSLERSSGIGATILEYAVVLVIIGVLAMFASTLMQSGGEDTHQESVDSLKNFYPAAYVAEPEEEPTPEEPEPSPSEEGLPE